LASDDLYLLDMRNGEEMAQWMIVPVVGSTPGRRYGHTIIFSKPHLMFSEKYRTRSCKRCLVLECRKSSIFLIKLRLWERIQQLEYIIQLLFVQPDQQLA